MKNPRKEDEGVWWVSHPSYNDLFLVVLKFETMDHTRDGDRWVIYDGNEQIEEHTHEWWNYNFVRKDEWPETVNI